jgi:oligopeptide/dipeptide ABC transporter ATP-binding protein
MEAVTVPEVQARSRDEPLLEVKDLRTRFSLRGSFLDRLRGHEAGSVKAVDGVSFSLRRGEVLGVVGESGSGKTTLGRTLLGLAAATDGSIKFEGREITGLSENAFRPLRRKLQIVFQDPHASLNPAMTIGESVGHPLKIHGVARTREEIEARVKEALERVGLAPADQYMVKYPTDLSGGQKQRAVLARAIILGPDILIADEPVSMLDMSVRAKILELMIDLQRELDLTYVYITHDLATAKFFCDRIAIMYLGKIVEIGPAKEIYAEPKHPYTVSLLEAIPEPDPTRAVARNLPRGEVPDAVTPPLGCSFHPRCPRAFEVCGWELRDLRTLLEARWTKMSEEEFRAERDVIGSLDPLDEPATSAEIEPASGHSASEVLEIIDRLRTSAPDDPFWRGVAEIRERDGRVAIRFHDGIEPRDVASGHSRLQCHLYDPEALEAAKAAGGVDRSNDRPSSDRGTPE